MTQRYEPTHDYLNDDCNAGLSAAEIGRCTIQNRKAYRQRFIPAFFHNQSQFRHVLAVRAWHFKRGAGGAPPPVEYLIANYKNLDMECGERAARIYRNTPTIQHAGIWKATTFAGSYIAGQVAICWRAWALTESSEQIAQHFGITLRFVSKTLESAIITAEKLGYPTFENDKRNRQFQREIKPYKTAEEKAAESSAKIKAYVAAHPEYHDRLSAIHREVQNRPSKKARLSELGKARWADPDKRAQMIAATRAAMQRPDVLAKQRAGRQRRKTVETSNRTPIQTTAG